MTNNAKPRPTERSEGGSKEVESCDARIHDTYFSYRCSRSGRQVRQGHPVCGTHARLYDKWVTEERAPSMAKFWWKWENDGAE